MVDRVEFSPLGGINPQQLFAQREARNALANSLATDLPQVNAPAPRPAPQAPRQAEQPEEEADLREEPQGQPPEGTEEPLPGLATGQSVGAEIPGTSGGPPAEALGPDARAAREAFQISVLGTELSRAQGAPLFGGLGPAGPENPLLRETAPLGEGGRREQVDFGPRPLGQGGGAADAAPPGPPGGGAPAPPVPGQNENPAAGQGGGNEPRGSVVNVLV
ncbi:MAG: hypothetical protein AABZ64_13150 [Nitrospinota bacterium]